MIRVILILFISIPAFYCTPKAPLSEDLLNRIRIDSTKTPYLKHPLDNEAPIQHPIAYEGEWEYHIPFYSQNLTLRKDSSFTYYDHGCIRSCFTEGRWSFQYGAIVLNSYKKYRKASLPAIETIHEPAPISSAEITTSDDTSQAGDTSRIHLKFILDTAWLTNINHKQYPISNSDTTFLFFKNEALKLEGDFLFQLDKNYMKTDNFYRLVRRY